jgi:lipopolysaccharide/colanic/teichoic acid biosynthesis glycosyltransferase
MSTTAYVAPAQLQASKVSTYGDSAEFLEPESLAWYGPWKVTAEIAFSLVLLVLTGPLILLAALLVKLTSRGPAFYSQTRVGRNRRLYTIYKLRTMYHECEKHSGPRWSTAGDTRITPVGRFLRRTHIDELPQLWNVLRREMSLVGPRPERPEFVPQLADAIPLYIRRLRVRPGVTGLAQVLLPADTDLDSVRRKLCYDLYYVRCCSPWLDLRLVVATAFHVIGVPYSLLGIFLGLPRGEAVEQVYEELLPEEPESPDLVPLVEFEMEPCL